MADDDVTVRISLQGGQATAHDVRQIDQEVRRLIVDINLLGRSDRDLNRITTSAGGMRREFGQLHSSVLGVATAVTNPLVNGLRLATFGLVGATAAAGAFGIKSLAAFDQSQTALDTLTGSVSAGHALMGQLQQYDLSTAFDFSQITAAAQTLQQFNISGAQTVPVLKALGDVAALTTNPSENLSRMAVAIGQISSSGVLRAQDLNQLIQAGFPAYQLAADASGIDMKTLRQQMETGGIALPADQFLGALTSYQGPIARYKGAAVRQGSVSLGGALSNLQSSVGQASVRTSEPYKDQLAGEIRGLTAGLVDIVEGVGPDFFHMLLTLGDFLVKELPHAQPVLTAIFSGIDHLVSAAGPAVDKILGPLSGEMGAELDGFFANLAPVIPDVVDAMVHFVMVLPDLLLLLSEMIRLSAPVLEFVDDLLQIDGVRQGVALLLAVLLGYRALTTIVGPIVAVTGALRGLAGASALAGGSGAAGAGGLLGRLGLAGAGAGGAGAVAGVAGAAGAGLAVVGGLEAWKMYGDHHSSADELATVGDRQPDWWDKITTRAKGGTVADVGAGQGGLHIAELNLHANSRDEGRAAAQGLTEYLDERAARR